MKIRIKEKDLIIFVIFSLFLLYVCAFVVGNVKSLIDNQSFSGLSPMPAFTSENIKLTFLCFFGALVVIISGASSFIFSRDKGKGIGLKLGGKEEKGYSRWATAKEIKKYADVAKVNVIENETTVAGVALINNGKQMFVDNGENHTLVIGATASGKTTSVVDPLVNSLAKKGESMIITDPKGEIYKNHSKYLKSKGYNVLVLNFRDPSLGNAWNPLTLPYQLYKSGDPDKSTELLDDVALNILIDPNSKAEPFWERSAADYFAGICLGLFEDAEESQININTVSYMATVGEEKIVTSNYIKEYFQLKGEDSSAYTFASNTINAPQDTKGSILSVFRQKIRLFATKEDLSEMLSYTDFDLRRIGNEKTAIFMVIHDEKTTYHALATIFIKQCYETLVASAYTQPNGKLPFRTNFILDEFANMPPLKDVTSMVTAARSRAIRFTLIIQNYAQLAKVYGKDDAETIKSNCGNLIYLLTTELAALEEISKLCGDVKSKGKDAEKTTSVPLVTVSDLQRLKMNEAIILKTRLNPYKTKLTPSYKINWGHKFDKAEFEVRKKEAIQLFDLKEFVKNKRKSKLLESMEEKPSSEAQKNINQPFAPYPFDVQMPGRSGRGPALEPDFDQRPSAFDPMTTSQQKPGQSLNLDDIVRQLDEQISKLEKEEAEANKKQTSQPFIDNRDKFVKPKPSLPETDIEKIEVKNVEDIKPDSNDSNVFDEQPKIEVNVTAPIIEIKQEEPVVFNVQEPVVQETIIPTEEDIKNINTEVKNNIPVEEDIKIDISTSEENSSEIKEKNIQEQLDISTEEVINKLDQIINQTAIPKEEIKVPESAVTINQESTENQSIEEFEKQSIEEFEKPMESVFPGSLNLPIEKLSIENSEQSVAVNEPITEIEEIFNEEDHPKINIDVDSVVINNNYISDDQFFDDFFADDE